MSARVALLATAVLAVPSWVVLTTAPSSGRPAGPASVAAMAACPPVQVTRTGAQSTPVEGAASDATWDLRGAVWDRVAPDPILYPVRSEAWTRGCIVGAQVNGDVPEGATRDQWFDGKHGGPRLGGEVFRVTLTNTPGNYVTIRDTVAADFEDAYDPNGWSPASTMYLDHVQARYIRDDCVENEGDGPPQVPVTLVVRRSLFDGCFSGFAERPPGAGSEATRGAGSSSLSVDDSLMYIQPQPLGPLYCSKKQARLGRCRTTAQPKVWLGSYGIWKWSRAAAARVTVRNTVFRLDMPSYSTCAGQDWPSGSYRNVWLVWTGAGPYGSAGGCTNRLPAGVRLTTDARVWDRAKADWAAGRSPVSSLPASQTATRVFARRAGHQVVGTVAAAGGRRLGGAYLTLQRRTVGSSRWASAARMRADVHGVVRRLVRPPRPSDFRWVFRGNARHAAAYSNAVRVRPR